MLKRFEPRNQKERQEFVAESLRFEFQEIVHRAMESISLSREEIAARAGMTVEQFERIISDTPKSGIALPQVPTGWRIEAGHSNGRGPYYKEWLVLARTDGRFPPHIDAMISVEGIVRLMNNDVPSEAIKGLIRAHENKGQDISLQEMAQVLAGLGVKVELVQRLEPEAAREPIPNADEEHQCGGPQEACCLPGCKECGTPAVVKPRTDAQGCIECRQLRGELAAAARLAKTKTEYTIPDAPALYPKSQRVEDRYRHRPFSDALLGTLHTRETQLEIYPLTLTLDRYGGQESGGEWVAWHHTPDELPDDLNAGSNEDQRQLWQELEGKKTHIYAVGKTPQDACLALQRRLQQREQKGSPLPNLRERLHQPYNYERSYGGFEADKKEDPTRA